MCIGGFASADYKALQLAAERGDRDSIRELAAKHGGRIVINEARGAVQLVGTCSPDVLASLPIAGSSVM
jgi:hypothetical protein